MIDIANALQDDTADTPAIHHESQALSEWLRRSLVDEVKLGSPLFVGLGSEALPLSLRIDRRDLTQRSLNDLCCIQTKILAKPPADDLHCRRHRSPRTDRYGGDWQAGQS